MWKKKTTDLKKKSPNLKNKLDTVFSRFIRLRDARKDGTFQCISCGRILPLDQADCGHYINRQHMSTRFSEKTAMPNADRAIVSMKATCRVIAVV